MENKLITREINYKTIYPTINIFTNVIFDHFIELSKLDYIKHTKQDIYVLLSSEQLFGYLVKLNGKIIAYLVGETTTTPDGRNVYFLSYIYVIKQYQHIKIGSMLVKKLISHCQDLGIPFIVLICDLHDKKVTNFYKKFGFVIDPILKNNKQHDALCLYL